MYFQSVSYHGIMYKKNLPSQFGAKGTKKKEIFSPGKFFFQKEGRGSNGASPGYFRLF